MLLAAALLAGCGELDDDPPPRPLGPGSGGDPLTGSTQTVTLRDTTGAAFGQVTYDDGHFAVALPFGPGRPTETDPTIGALQAADGVSLGFVLIAGRPDTPCRFEAALAARDEGYTILGDGEDRINDVNVTFHEVWLARGAEWVRLDCAQLNGQRGVQVVAQSPSGNALETVQVHFVLNSIRP